MLTKGDDEKLGVEDFGIESKDHDHSHGHDHTHKEDHGKEDNCATSGCSHCVKRHEEEEESKKKMMKRVGCCG